MAWVPQYNREALERAALRSSYGNAAQQAGAQALGAARSLGRGNPLAAARAGANAAGNASARILGQQAAQQSQLAVQQQARLAQEAEERRTRTERMMGGLLGGAGQLVGMLAPAFGPGAPAASMGGRALGAAQPQVAPGSYAQAGPSAAAPAPGQEDTDPQRDGSIPDWRPSVSLPLGEAMARADLQGRARTDGEAAHARALVRHPARPGLGIRGGDPERTVMTIRDPWQVSEGANGWLNATRPSHSVLSPSHELRDPFGVARNSGLPLGPYFGGPPAPSQEEVGLPGMEGLAEALRLFRLGRR